MAQSTSSRGWVGTFTALLFISMSLLATKEMRLSKESISLGEPIAAAASTLSFPDNGHPLRPSYTGIEPVDAGLRFLVAAFLPAAAGWDKGSQIQQIYFLISFFSVVSVWSIESTRNNNARGWTRFTSIWAIFYQTVGGAIVIPLYYLAYLRDSAQKDYWLPVSRQVSTSYAKALLPSLVMGYLIPTIAMYLPYNDPDLYITQGFVALWQPCPFIINFLLFVISAAYGNQPTTSKKAASASKNVKYLDRLYLTCFVVAAIAHIGTMAVCLSSTDPQMSLIRAIVLVPPNERLSMAGILLYIFQVDFWIIFAAAVVGAYIGLWDVKRAGLTNLSLSTAAAVMAIGVILVGPAATVAATWYVREHAMLQNDKKK